MKTIYLIKHYYDVDGGFGDAVGQEEIIGATKNKEKAEEYVRRYNNPVVYDSPYSDLYHHALGIEELQVKKLDLDKCPWGDDWEPEEEDEEEVI